MVSKNRIKITPVNLPLSPRQELALAQEFLEEGFNDKAFQAANRAEQKAAETGDFETIRQANQIMDECDKSPGGCFGP